MSIESGSGNSTKIDLHIDVCGVCGHLLGDHYDCTYCLHEECCCGPCLLCGAQYVERPMNHGACKNCKKLQEALEGLLESE